MFSAFAAKAKAKARAREAQASEGKAEKTSIWDVLDDDAREPELPPPPLPATKKKRTSETTAPAGVKKPRTRKVTGKPKAEKKPPLRNGKIQAKVVKSPLEAATTSKYFPEKQQGPPDISITLDPVPKRTALAPKLPNQESHPEPPLHVIRRQWTPVKDTNLPLDSSPHLANGELKIDKASVFGSMIDTMRYSTELPESTREASVSMENRAENVLIKKRVIEVIEIHIASNIESGH